MEFVAWLSIFEHLDLKALHHPEYVHESKYDN